MANFEKNTRRCIACRNHDNKANMLRITKCNGNILKDVNQNMGGRGVWIHKNEECLKLMVKKSLLNATFKTCIDKSVYEDIING